VTLYEEIPVSLTKSILPSCVMSNVIVTVTESASSKLNGSSDVDLKIQEISQLHSNNSLKAECNHGIRLCYISNL